jgi:LysM repeat protein
MTAVDPVARPQPPASGDPRPTRPFSGVCPYLAAVDGGWRSSTVAREHRCGAVSPPAPLAAEKQRRLCLTHDHVICATYDAARAARPVAHDRLPVLPRPIARTTPVVLDHGRIAIGVPALHSDRPVWQAILIGILAIAFAAIVLTRVTDGGTSGATTGASHSPGQSVAASAVATGAAASQDVSTAGPSGALDPTPGSGASAGPSDPGPSAVATQTYKVKTGDTLVGIAAKFGTTPKAIATLNGITDPTSLHAGQILKIP